MPPESRRGGGVQVSVRRSLLGATTAGFAAVIVLHLASPSGRSASALGSTTTTKPSSTTAPTGLRSAVGPSEQFGYGAISVKVTVNGTRVVAVSVAGLQTAESYSQSLANQVDPLLTSEAISAQSANIQSISGASYTSEGFAQSLQAALGDLGL
jgi:uncharacterized protein with FMN-binding domain